MTVFSRNSIRKKLLQALRYRSPQYFPGKLFILKRRCRICSSKRWRDCEGQIGEYSLGGRTIIVTTRLKTCETSDPEAFVEVDKEILDEVKSFCALLGDRRE